MLRTHDAQEVLRHLSRWAERRVAVRAMLLTSTRAIPHATVDALSDYDVVLVVRDLRPFLADRRWVGDFGDVLVAYWDPLGPDRATGVAQAGNVIQYDDGLKIDFRLWPVALVERLVQLPALPPELDAGYRVLADKDGLATRLQPPTYRAYIPDRPSEETYQTLIQEFFSDAPYVAKFLWRDELLPAKWCLDYDMKQVYLLRMLEWRMERDHGWAVPVRTLGKGLQQRLPAELGRGSRAPTRVPGSGRTGRRSSGRWRSSATRRSRSGPIWATPTRATSTRASRRMCGLSSNVSRVRHPVANRGGPCAPGS